MGWESARRRPHSGLPGGAYKQPPPPPRPPPEPPEPIVYTHDEVELTMRYGDALRDLANEDRRFHTNHCTFSRWQMDRKLKWIYAIEQQALDGLDTIGIHVVARVVMNRLEQ